MLLNKRPQAGTPSYVAVRPWVALRDHHVLKLEHPADGSSMYAIAMGDGGQEFGVSVHLGPYSANDLAGDDQIISPRVAMMTEFHPDGPNRDAPGMVHHRIEPARSMVRATLTIMLGLQSEVSNVNRRALIHTLQAATDLARTTHNPGSVVRDRDNPTQIHLVTSTLNDRSWHHSMEVVTVLEIL